MVAEVDTFAAADFLEAPIVVAAVVDILVMVPNLEVANLVVDSLEVEAAAVGVDILGQVSHTTVVVGSMVQRDITQN